MNISILKKSMYDTKFGIEIETCLHILNKSVNNIEDNITYFYNCISKKHKNIKWEMSLDSSYRSDKYDKWVLQPDDSLSCSLKNDREEDTSCVYENSKHKLSFCEQFNFYPIEIVTPILDFYTGTKQFTIAWFGILMNNNFVYTVNDSQGLHINLSHPNLKLRKFLNWWKLFEHDFISVISKQRRIDAVSFSLPLNHKSLKDRDVLELVTSDIKKYLSINVHNYDKENVRIEIRLYQGTMDYFEIYNWLMTCILFLNVTITSPEELPIINKNTFTSLLNYIVDDSIQRFLIHKHNINNSKQIFYKPSKINIIPKPWKILNKKEQQRVLQSRYEKC